MAGPFAPGLQIVGVGKEATKGVAVAPTAYLKFEKFEAHPVINDALDQSIRADMADIHGATQTTIFVEIDFEMKIAPDDLGWLTTNLYGSLVTTGASAPFLHTNSLLNTTDGQGPTHTFTHYNGIETRRYAYARVSELTFKYAVGDLLAVSGKMIAASQATTTVPTPTFTAIPPVAAWATTVTISAAQSSIFTDFELTLARTVTPVFTLANTQAPYVIQAGGDFKATLKGTAVYDAATLFGTTYLSGAVVPIVINTTTGAGAGLVQIQHTLTQVYLNDAKISQGSNYMELAIDGTGVANATDAGPSGGAAPSKTVLQSAIAASIYA